jgi:hypothetical protein
MGLYTIGQIIMDPIYGQISYHCWLANASNFKLGHYLRICLVEMRRATGKEIATHVFRPLKIIPASRVKARCAQLLIIIRSDSKILMRVVELRERRTVGNRMILLSM